MHEIVAYEGVVLRKRGAREADVLVDILTSQGLLRAVAKSARTEQSKLRYGLETLSRARYSLVRGRHEWRLTGVTDVSRAFSAAPPQARSAMARVTKLLMRLVAGEGPSPVLFATVIEGLDALSKKLPSEKVLGSPPPQSDHFLQEISSLETVLVLRVLSHLGYLPQSEALKPFIEGEFDITLSAKALEARGLLIRTINESLQATGL